jgi:hypothetical protein
VRYGKLRAEGAVMNPDKAAKWEAWIADIREDVFHLMDSRRWNAVFERVVNANPRLNPGQVIPDYFRKIYADYAILAVRRLVRRDNKSITLTDLLRDLSENNEMVTREWYRALYKRPFPDGQVYDDEMAYRLADSAFENFCDNDSHKHISKALIEQDLAKITVDTATIVHVSDRAKAHKDKRGLDPNLPIPTFTALDVAITTLADITQKYVLLLTGAGMASMTPFDQTNALQVFHFPWIDTEHRPDLGGIT